MNFTKDDIFGIIDGLEQMHPQAHCELNYSTPFELLVAVILSAQCTDKRVNEVTKTLFEKYNTPQEFANLQQEELEELIKTCGFYRNKAKNIINCAKEIIEWYNGEVPSDRDELIKLSGVGRKTANVVYSVAYNGQAIAVDTHVLRLANRIGFIKSKDPYEVEKKLMQIMPQNKWSRIHHLLIFHGRYVCQARNPKCQECTINSYCRYRSKK